METSSPWLRKWMVAGTGLWRRYLQSEWQTIHSTLSLFITFIAYWQPFPMHRLQNTASPTVYTQTIKKVYHKAYHQLNLNVEIRRPTEMLLNYLMVLWVSNNLSINLLGREILSLWSQASIKISRKIRQQTNNKIFSSYQ